MENKNKKRAYRAAAVNSDPPPHALILKLGAEDAPEEVKEKEKGSFWSAEQTASSFFTPQTVSQSVGEGAGLRPAPPPPPPLCGISHQPLRRSKSAAPNCREFVYVFFTHHALGVSREGAGSVARKGRG